MYGEERKKSAVEKSRAWPSKAITPLIEICWTNMICQSAECISVLLQMGNMAVSNSGFQWNCSTKLLFHQPFFCKTICGMERTRPRRCVVYLWRAAVLQRDTPNRTCTGDLPSPNVESRRHTLARPDGAETEVWALHWPVSTACRGWQSGFWDFSKGNTKKRH